MKKEFIFIMALFSFFICILFIKESYGKYISATKENAEITVARWKILVNNKDIRNESSASTIITPVFPGNEHIAEGIIAPTSEGYFDLIIDSSNTDVSFKYNISFSVNANSAVKDLVAFKYTINDGEEIMLNGQSIENTVLYSKNPSPIKIRVFVVWNDGEGSIMDNEADTNATGGSAKMNINLSFIQIK